MINKLNSFVLSNRSLRALDGVHPDLVRIVKTAIDITEVDFVVLEGLRTVNRQKKLFNAGATKTMNSRHLTGHAVDLGAWVDGTVRWDWPLYHHIAHAMKKAAGYHSTRITWGGDWQSFPDGPHFELLWDDYPKAW